MNGSEGIQIAADKSEFNLKLNYTRNLWSDILHLKSLLRYYFDHYKRPFLYFNEQLDLFDLEFYWPVFSVPLTKRHSACACFTIGFGSHFFNISLKVLFNCLLRDSNYIRLQFILYLLHYLTVISHSRLLSYFGVFNIDPFI